MKPMDKKSAGNRSKKVVDIKAVVPGKPDKRQDVKLQPNWKRATQTLKAKPGDEKRAALARLGVSAEALNLAPPITPILKRADGGVAQVIDSMRLVQGDAAGNGAT